MLVIAVLVQMIDYFISAGRSICFFARIFTRMVCSAWIADWMWLYCFIHFIALSITFSDIEHVPV